jgi:hypothetical protein
MLTSTNWLSAGNGCGSAISCGARLDVLCSVLAYLDAADAGSEVLADVIDIHPLWYLAVQRARQLHPVGSGMRLPRHTGDDVLECDKLRRRAGAHQFCSLHDRDGGWGGLRG